LHCGLVLVTYPVTQVEAPDTASARGVRDGARHGPGARRILIEAGGDDGDSQAVELDPTVLCSLRQQDDVAWAQVAELFYSRLLIFCSQYVNDRGDARDIVHDTFVRAKERIDQYDREKPFSGWLFAIARHRAFDLWRKGRHEVQIRAITPSSSIAARYLDDVRDGQPGPRTECEQADQYQRLLECLDELSDIQAEIIMLRYLQQLSRKEIAALLDIPENTVKSRLLNGLRSLREVVDRNGIDPTRR
jgi:RNA polymerase sigma-70 factor, ECF subfamily